MPLNFNFKSSSVHLNNALKKLSNPRVNKHLKPSGYQTPQIKWNTYLKRTGGKGF